jgi:hypothetical protein
MIRKRTERKNKKKRKNELQEKQQTMETFGERWEGHGTQHTQNPNLYILKNQN